MNKVVDMQEALDYCRDGAVLMIGGFLAVGTPEMLVDGLVAKNVRDLTIIANDTAFPDKGLGKLIVNKQVKKVIASHLGTNPETGRQMMAGELEVELAPQGSLAERVRCGGAGLGGVLTETGLGTVAAEGKQELTVNGKTYLLELPLRGDVALIKAHKADKQGNLVFRRTARNFNSLFALAADVVIAEVEELVEVGELDSDMVMIPGVVVDMLVLAREGA